MPGQPAQTLTLRTSPDEVAKNPRNRWLNWIGISGQFEVESALGLFANGCDQVGGNENVEVPREDVVDVALDDALLLRADMAMKDNTKLYAKPAIELIQGDLPLRGFASFEEFELTATAMRILVS